MKTKRKPNRIKPKSVKNPQVKKPTNKQQSINHPKLKNSFATDCNSELQLRRSTRISERHLQLRFSLPDSDDSENEADDGAYEELLALSDCEDNEAQSEIDSDRECVDDDDNISDEDNCEYLEHSEQAGARNEGSTSWGHNTGYFDKLEQTFRDSPSIGDIGQTEIDCFGTIFDDQVLSLIITETNRYAKQNNSKNWTDVTPDEMKAFIGCLIVMGIHQLPALKHYWSSDPFLRVESVASVMTANRFKKIIENVHCNDNETQPQKTDPTFDKLHKVRPILELLNANSRSIYKPSAVVTVDESMIPFKGRYTLKQYMPNKPVKWGYKVWCLCDSYTGFVIAFFIYTGKDDKVKNITLGENVVTKLVEAANVEPGSLVVMDNFFSSCSLFENLLRRDNFACGTVKRNSKGLPDFMRKNKQTEKNMARGEFQFGVKNRTAAVKWMDRKAVCFLSSVHSPRKGSTVLRRQRNGTRIEVGCPEVVKVYNETMGGVDKFDQLRECYAVGRRSVKWWHRIFYYLIDLAIVNSYVMWKEKSEDPSKCHQLDFRIHLARQLIGGYTSRKNRGRPPNFVKQSVPDSVRLSNVGSHMPEKQRNSRRCKCCASKKVQKRTLIVCTGCKVPLCISPCFINYHK